MATVNIQVTVPDAAIPKIRQVFGGGTNAQTLTAVQAWAGPVLAQALRDHVADARLAARVESAKAAVKTAQAEVETARTAELAEIESVWPS